MARGAATYEMLARSTWANIRLRNELVNGKEGYWTTHQPGDEVMTIFDAAQRYRAEGVPLIALAGKEYGLGSSRDSAVKGPWLLGVKAVIAGSYERIHRSNLVSMGILPLQYLPSESRESRGLSPHSHPMRRKDRASFPTRFCPSDLPPVWSVRPASRADELG